MACGGSVANELLSVRCSTIVRPDLLGFQEEDSNETISEFQIAVRGMDQLKDPDPIVELRGYHESLLVPFHIVESFFRDYCLSSYGVRLDPVDDSARSRGASAVLTFGRGEFRMDEPTDHLR